MRLLEQLSSWAKRRIPEEFDEPHSHDFVRAQLLLVLTGAWAALCAWSIGYQLLWGAPRFALVALGSLLVTATVPYLLRRTGSLMLAGNVLTCAPFLGLSFANVASAGGAVASVILLAFVPLVAALVIGRRSACLWTGIVCLELLALPQLQQLGMPALIEANPDAARGAIFRATFLGALLLLAGVFAYEAATERGFRLSGLYRKLRQSEQRHRQLAETSPDGICITRAGLVSFANPALLALLGIRNLETLRGRRLLDFVHPDDHEALVRLASSGGQANAPSVSEVRLRSASGGECAVEVSVAMPVKSSLREGLYMFHDLTNRRLLEEQFRQSQKMEAIGLLAGGVAHDFNNLLTVILCETEALLQDPEVAFNPERRRGLEGIQNAGERSAALTRKLLAFGRRQLLEPRRMDVNEVVAGVIDMLRRLVPETIQIDTDLAPSLPRVTADPVQLEQVILNVVLNARDASARNILLTTRSLSGGARHGSGVELRVSDDGCGMDSETCEKAFEPFFTTKGPGSGTGLGLSTVHGIVYQSGGSVALESERDKGTTLRITLPAEEQADERSVASNALRRDLPRAGGTETVLLVEDEPGVRRVAATVLRSAGYHVIEAADGVEALEAYRCHLRPIELVVSDIVMPNMGGAELVDRLRAKAPDLAVLLMSGYGGDSPPNASGQSHALLRKPFTRRELVTEVRRVLDAADPPLPALQAAPDGTMQHRPIPRTW